MSIKIHHGPPGSYKTSGAVNDDFLREALQGRVIITNVRGLTGRDRIINVINSRFHLADYLPFLNRFEATKKRLVPDSFDIINVDTDNYQGRAKLAGFFHWIPHGSFLIIDEAQFVFPVAWKELQLRKLDYPGGLEAATAANRPPDFLTAFDKHRHYGWDMVLTTPNISKIRKDIRDASEGAYKHKNQALVGIKGRYLEAFHMASDSGSSKSDFLSLRHRKISKFTWSLYASTATGTHSDTVAGTPIWKNPRIVFHFSLMALLLLFLSGRSAPSYLRGQDSKNPAQASKVDSKAPSVVSAVPAASPGPVPSNIVPVNTDDKTRPALKHPFDGFTWRMAGTFTGKGVLTSYFVLTNDTKVVTLSSGQLLQYGYAYKQIDSCHVDITHSSGSNFAVFCFSDKDHQKPKTLLSSASNVLPGV